MTQLTLIIVVLLALIIWLIRENHNQQKKLIKALLSKDVQEFTNSELAENIKPKKEKKSDLVPLQDVSDDDFYKALKKQKGK
jgi:hypothetical protein